jgi:hypothetical protein
MHTYGLKESKEENSYVVKKNENTSTLKPT